MSVNIYGELGKNTSQAPKAIQTARFELDFRLILFNINTQNTGIHARNKFQARKIKLQYPLQIIRPNNNRILMPEVIAIVLINLLSIFICI
jgi:hypothetical protein